MTRPPTAQINETLITLLPKETVLNAALRNGIPFPNSCRVGGCATCKCKLAEGEVKQLTRTSYLLSAEELEQGVILACQSIPRTDVRIEVELGARARPRVGGTVVEQIRVTHDITHLVIQLDAPLSYRAGQFADLELAAMPGVVRCYSFATPPSVDGRVGFYIRKVPGGQLSSYVHEHDLRGTRVGVGEPAGDFWLRESDAPLLMIAGGSGLPPILAMLQQAAADGVARPVTLLFGVQTESDLYALDQIDTLARTWRGGFRFVPVLSAATSADTTTLARGRVTEVLPDLLEPDAHVYLCGPPAMIDHAREVLDQHGLDRQHVRFDRFTTRADAAVPSGLPPTTVGSTSRIVGALHYLKFFLFHLVGLFAVGALLAGGWYLTLGLVAVLAFYLIGDAIGGDDTSTPTFRHPALLTAQLWLALPLLGLIVFTSVWSVSTGDPLGFGAWVSGWSGHDVLAARAVTSAGHHVSGLILTGLMIGMIGTISAHELTHRTWDPVSMLIGRWLLAFSFDTTFAIEHVYGHHRYVSTTEDPATAPRGRNVYVHVLVSTLRGNASAWRIEIERLAKERHAPLSWRNAVLRGHLMSVLLVVAVGALGGTQAMGYFVACALWGKALLEIVNYMEHYGMVRNPTTPVQPRHSWNTNRRLSSWTMFNLTRHSHHHAQGEVAYHDLRPYPDAPMMIGGYLTTLVVALVPPLWFRLMNPRVLAWDRDYATAEERALASRANAKSGAASLEGVAYA